MVGTNCQAGELYGILEVLEQTDNNNPLKIEVSSKETVDILTDKIQSLEDRGFLGVKSSGIIKKVMTSARKRKAKTFIKKI